MSAKSRSYNPLRLFNSVPFGVTTMALIAVYMATGSGRQWLRSTGVDQWPVLRDWFDKTDLEFFNAWPLKTLMALLVVNLIVVTWRKIPLTPPRYGVWCIHAGIVTLVLGSAVYYGHKLEGRVRIYADPAAGPNTVEGYYDKDERALYVRTGKDVPAAFPLPTLPRFQGYDETVGNVDSLRRRGLWGIRPTLTAADKDGRPVHESLAELVGAKGDFSADVVGFYPYANVRTDFDRTDPASTVTGVELSMGDPNDPATMSDWYVVASDPRYKLDTDHLMEVQHVEGDADVATKLREAAGQFFHLDVTTPGAAVPVGVYVKPGQSIPIGATGYTLKVETYNPAWPMFGTGVPVQALTMLVTSPGQTFRRMVLAGKALQTDFKLNDPKAGPMGGRQKVPLDAGLQIGLTVEDPYRLMPTEKAIKHTLVTPTGSAELVDVSVNDVGGVDGEDVPDRQRRHRAVGPDAGGDGCAAGGGRRRRPGRGGAPVDRRPPAAARPRRPGRHRGAGAAAAAGGAGRRGRAVPGRKAAGAAGDVGEGDRRPVHAVRRRPGPTGPVAGRVRDAARGHRPAPVPVEQHPPAAADAADAGRLQGRPVRRRDRLARLRVVHAGLPLDADHERDRRRRPADGRRVAQPPDLLQRRAVAVLPGGLRPQRAAHVDAVGHRQPAGHRGNGGRVRDDLRRPDLRLLRQADHHPPDEAAGAGRGGEPADAGAGVRGGRAGGTGRDVNHACRPGFSGGPQGRAANVGRRARRGPAGRR